LPNKDAKAPLVRDFTESQQSQCIHLEPRIY